MQLKRKLRIPALLLMGAVAHGWPGAPIARAELAPWVYGEQQRQAPVVVQLEVLSAAQVAGDWQVHGRVLKVIRQPNAGLLRPNERVQIRYPLPEVRPPGMVGPSPVPVLRPGETVTAWIRPIPRQKNWFSPAAGGRSFGPAMEDQLEPR
jgi:hypothetical protein